MSIGYSLIRKVSARDLFDGRLDEYEVREHIEPGKTSQKERCLTDGENYLSVMPDIWDAEGKSYVAEKMRATHREEARKKPAPRQSGKKLGEPRSTGQSEATKRTADKYIPDPDRKK